MTDPQDTAELRLRAADPAGPSRALPPPRVERTELLEGIMTTTTEPAAQAPAPKSSRSRWLLAAAAVVAIAAGGTAVALTVGNDSSPVANPPMTVKTLHLSAGGPGATSCVRFTVDILRDMPVAFDGTVSEVTDKDALLTVNHWYKGGSADEVRLENPNYPTEIEMEGGVHLQVGQRYLVTATNGTVNGCGYTAEWSAELEKSFQEAFGS